jgi:hypothetical protein
MMLENLDLLKMTATFFYSCCATGEFINKIRFKKIQDNLTALVQKNIFSGIHMMDRKKYGRQIRSESPKFQKGGVTAFPRIEASIENFVSLRGTNHRRWSVRK